MKPTDPNAPGDFADQAAAWRARLAAPDCSSGDRAYFEDWLAQSPAHVEAWLEMERVEAIAASLAADPLIRAAARQARRHLPAAGLARRWLPAAAALAATLVIALGVVLWVLRSQAPTVTQYATAVGEQRLLDLADGTQVLLDTDSALTTRFSATARQVELQRGRAQFVVGQDARRPFTVQAGAATIEDIGTTFQASHLAGEVRVALLEGTVVVSLAAADGGPERSVLSPGQQILVDRAGSLQPWEALDLAIARAWPRGELVFKNRRLDALLTEMNRYSDTPVTLADPALGDITVSGVFHIGDQTSLIAALEQGWAMRSQQVDGGGIVLRRDRASVSH